MNYLLSFMLSIILTSLSYFFGSKFIKYPIKLWQSFVIGTSVVSLGAITEALGAPIWLVVLIPFPVGMGLLYIFLRKSLRVWFVTYVTILVLYTVIHVFMSFIFDFHSLIPAWRL